MESRARVPRGGGRWYRTGESGGWKGGGGQEVTEDIYPLVTDSVVL